MKIGSSLAAIALLASLNANAQDAPASLPVPGEPGVGTWSPFLINDSGTYSFDKPALVRRDGHVFARWKVAWGDGAITMQAIDLDCRTRTFSELGTLVIKPDGTRRTVPTSELWVAHRIVDGDSMDSFAVIVCS